MNDLTAILGNLSALSTFIIAVACAVHVLFFLFLWVWFRRDLKKIAASLDEFTRGLKHRSLFDSTSHLSDQIEAFLTDVNEIVQNPAREKDRRTLAMRINVLDERRRYLQSMAFETAYNICRTMIEAYPLAGVLGTILAIGSALQTNDGAGTVNVIVGRFGDAIWSTFAGLTAGILLMFLNSVLETRFERLAENREHVRDTIVRTKRELSLLPEEPA
jgi:biopolymer transport protein ExbB